MIKMSYKDLHDPMFTQGLKKLVNEPLPLQIGYWVGRIQDKIVNESKVAQAGWTKVLETKVEWDGEGADKKPKDIKQLRDTEAEYLSIVFDLGKIRPIHVQDISTAKLTALELMALRPILAGLDTLVDAETDVIEGDNVTPIK